MAVGVVWENVSWRQGEDRFHFEIERGGLFATMKAPGNRSFTLPMVVWEGLLDAIKANRSTKARTEQQFPVRTGVRWYEGEASELALAFRTGRSIAALAKAHNRTEYAIENQLDKMGLFSKAEKYGPGAVSEAGRLGVDGGEFDRRVAAGDRAGQRNEDAVGHDGARADPPDGVGRFGDAC